MSGIGLEIALVLVLMVVNAAFAGSEVALISLREGQLRRLEAQGGRGRLVAEPAAIVVVTIVLTFASLVVGELAPKRIALQRSEGWAKLAARPLATISTATKPLVWLLSRSCDALARLAGVDPAAQREPVTEEEVRDMIATQPSFPSEQRTILVGALEITERRLREVLVPRPDAPGG